MQPCEVVISPTEMKIQHGKNNSTSAGKSAPINDSLRSEMYSEGIFLIGDGKVIKKKTCNVPRSFEKSGLRQKS